MHREQRRGVWTEFKKTALTQSPVPDVDRISKRALKRLASCFDRIVDAQLEPLSEAGTDRVRMGIDRAISDVLGLPDISPIRGLLANEPIVTLKPLR